MHLGNGIICPMTAVPMAFAAGGALFYAFKKSKKEFQKASNLSFIVLTVLVFALQMINFAIPQVGASGHVVGAILLCALLGQNRAFLSMSLILFVQSLLYADGGLMALGCNIFNMGFLACYVAYPYIFKPLKEANKPVLASIISSIAALQLASIAVIAEAYFSGSIQGSILNFTLLMQTIHLPIGLFEGLVTAGICALANKIKYKNFAILTGIVSIFLAGIVSQFKSTNPDGLEWSLMKISDSIVNQTQGVLFKISESIQAKTAILSSMPEINANITGVLFVAFCAFILCVFFKTKTQEN